MYGPWSSHRDKLLTSVTLGKIDVTNDGKGSHETRVVVPVSF